MAKKHEPKPPGQWTTLDELLLVFAVKRHGSKNWNAIAKELQSRVAMHRNYVSSSLITVETCRDEFLRLRRQFAAETKPEEEDDEACLAPMLDELRRIRIEELRREVKRRDASIVLLESRIKRLEEERERSLKEETDLRGERSSEPGESTPSPPENLAGKLSSAESIVTAPRDAQHDAVKKCKSASKGKPEGKTGSDPVKALTEPDRDRGYSSRLTKNADNGEDQRDGGETATAATRACRLGESSESKREAAMVDLLRRIRSHRLGSAFERRLRIQESERYRELIRQHMDLRTIKSRLDRGAYAGDSRKFFRDLLLIFNNAIVFYRRTSSEYAAAISLRALVLKETKVRPRNRTPERVPSLKPKMSKPVISACGKRDEAKSAAQAKMKTKEKEPKKQENKEVDSLIIGPKGKKESSMSDNQSNNITGSSYKDEKKKKHEFGNNELSSHDAPTIKSANVKKKKQGAAKFLRRIKQVSSSESEEEEDVSGSEVEEETKKKKKKKGVVTRSTSSNGKRVKEENMKGNKKTGKRGRESNGEGRGNKRAKR